MRALIQRVKHASVNIDSNIVSSIENGLLVFVGFCSDDTEALIKPMAEKLAGLRIFEDENERMNLSVSDVGGEILVVSQFTLYADCRKGKRPSFTDAMKPETANSYYKKFVETIGDITGVSPKTGEFGADMKVELVNDGPVTIMLDSAQIVK